MMGVPPVLLIAFNRPETTTHVWQAIRKARPSQLFVSIDGPRSDFPEDEARILQVRQLVEQVDWPCETRYRFPSSNAGCCHGPADAIHWFFEHVEAGIILEDDTVPDLSFFSYCGELLERYRTDDRVMMISGTNLQHGKRFGSASYYATHYVHIWGWATWRRAWRAFQIDVQPLEDWLSGDSFRSLFLSEAEADFWRGQLKRIPEDAWCFRWNVAIWRRQGLCLVPNQNLISNIGFGELATHTTRVDRYLADLPCMPMAEISHPKALTANLCAGHRTYRLALLGERGAVTYKVRELWARTLPYLQKVKACCRRIIRQG